MTLNEEEGREFYFKKKDISKYSHRYRRINTLSLLLSQVKVAQTTSRFIKTALRLILPDSLHLDCKTAR